MVMIYVDDLILVYHPRNHSKFLERETQQLKLYEFRIMGDAVHFLRIRIKRNREKCKLWLIQDSCIEKLSKNFKVRIDKAPMTPLQIGTNWSKWKGKASSTEISAYQRRVGSNGFSSFATWPDLAKAIFNLSSVLHNPSPDQARAVDHYLQYLI